MSNAIRWSPETLAAHQAKILRAAAATKRWQAKGRLPKGSMNKTEAAYAEELERLRLAGEIIGWKFHPMRIRLADNTYYEVDFLTLDADLTLTIRETKGGFTSDKGQIKIKLCAEVLPWFRMLKVTKLSQKQGGGWKIEDFSRP